MSIVYGVKCTFSDRNDNDDVGHISNHIHRYTSMFGLANFVCYPLGGMNRFNWRLDDGHNVIPNIHLPGPILPANKWRRCVCGLVSSWIDPDDENNQFATKSATSLIEELDHANYLLIDTVVLQLKRVDSKKLADVLHQWLRYHTPRFRIWVVLPTALSALKPEDLMPNEHPLSDLWSVWHKFHGAVVGKSADNPLEVGLRFCDDSDEEFFDDRWLGLWRGEMLTSVWLNESLFFGDNQKISLNSFTAGCLERLSDIVQYVVFEANNESDESIRRIGAQREVVNAIIARQPQSESPAVDVLQIPLEPLINNMSSAVYETFERDDVKYQQYGHAIRLALTDIAGRPTAVKREFNTPPQKIIAFVLGAGRGPLVDRLLQQFDILKTFEETLELEAWAVEKNPSAIQDLRYHNEKKWKGKVRILQDDIRNLFTLLQRGVFDRPDLVVSELLGSIADNELSPECLNAAEAIFHDRTISIPSSYRNFLAPIHSSILHQRLLERTRLREMPEVKASGRVQNAKVNPMDCLYVCVPKRVHVLGPPVQLFEYHHPRRGDLKVRGLLNRQQLYFILRAPCSIIGFFGYFNAVLYGDVTLSTVPGEHTFGMYSWAPAFLPLRKLISCVDERGHIFMELTVTRESDAGGIWYEWSCNHVTAWDLHSEVDVDSQKSLKDYYPYLAPRLMHIVQNLKGDSHYIRLQNAGEDIS